ncbi:MAG: L,D-transpeptidase [Cyanobacteriota bacterium]|nr:L,D-transpeptidase [Cyanobacteriota bacterium]
MGRFLRPLTTTVVLTGTVLLGLPRSVQAIEPPPPVPAAAAARNAVVNLPSAASAIPSSAPAASAPAAAPATAAISGNREIVLELGKRTISLLENGQVKGSWPVAVGDPATPTPTGRFKVRNKVVNPQYQSTKSGKNNPTIGPQGPLGDRWIGFHYTERDQFGIHGTPTAWEWTVKSRSAVSHGCVRMLTPHVRQLFDQVDVGTPVVVKP